MKKNRKKITREQVSWESMKTRCYNPKSSHYKYYGEKGIIVCERWRNSFENFLEDMGERPEGKTLERIDSNGDYCPENCKWKTIGKQNFNIGMKSNNTSGRSGVSIHNGTRWKAYIGVDRKNIFLGVYNTFEEACKAREDAELKYYGFIKQ